MVERYRGMISAGGGAVHRHEDWGRRQLTFPISKVHKAHYVLINVECDQKTLDELTGAFRFSDAVLRHLATKVDAAITEPSPMFKASDEGGRDDGPLGGDRDDDDERGDRGDRGDRGGRDRGDRDDRGDRADR